MRRAYSFRPPLWAVLLAAAACVAFVVLGNWQSHRADEKRAAGATAEPTNLRGTFVERYTVLVDNRLHRKRAGYHVVQAMRVAGDGAARHVLVNRGWIALGASRDALPAIRTPAGEVAIEGLRLQRFAQAYDPGGGPLSAGGVRIAVWQNATVEAFAAWSGLLLEPWVLEQHSLLDDGLIREWPARGTGADVHESYALQWYSFAAATVILLAALGWRRNAPPAA